MELKPGHRETGIGVVPEDWESKRLGDHVTFLRSGVNSRAELTLDDPIKYLHYGDIHSCASVMLDPASLPSLPSGKAKNLDRLRDGDLAFADASEDLVGVSKSVEICGASNTEIVSGLHTIVARFDKDTLADGFKSYLQFCPDFYGQLRRLAAGTKVYAIYRSHIASVEMRLPRVNEQKIIAAALGDMDALLNGLDRLITKKRDLKQAVMQQLLTGKTRLPGFEGKWEVKQIREFTTYTAGGTPSTLIPEFWSGPIPWMNSGELHQKQVNEVDDYITEYGLLNSSAKMLPIGCVLIGLAGQGRTRGTVAMNLTPLCTNQSIAAILPNSNFVPEYLYHNLDSKYTELRDLSSGGGGRGGLNLTIIGSIIIPFPSISEQRAIAAVLTDMDVEIAALEQRRTKIKNIKQAMMHELLTGKTRLVTPGGSNVRKTSP